MILRKIKNFFVVLGVLTVVLIFVLILFKNNLTIPKNNSNRAAVIKQIQSLSRLETASFTIEKIIDQGTTGNNVFQRLLFGDKILLIAHGQAIAGFDLSKVTDQDIQVPGKKLRVNFPPPWLLSVILN